MKDLSEIQSLSVPERMELVSAIWNSLFRDLENLPVSQQLREELDRDLEAHRENPESSVPWAEVDRELFGEG